MADYKGIKGGKIQNFATNPPAPIVGQVWYNETTRTINYFSSSPAGAWATGTDLNTAKNEAAGAGHTQTSAIAFAGSPGVKALAESWNGSAWTEVGDLNNDRYDPAGAGASNTAALCFGGIAPGFTGNAEKWNGTAWTEVGDLNTPKLPGAGCGTNTAALSIGGNTPPNNYVDETESWNGTSWTELGNISRGTGYIAMSSAGVNNTAALLFGAYHISGSPAARVALNESWNGTSWTEVADLNTARNAGGAGGTSTAALCWGGATPSVTAVTEKWNGTSWTEVGDLNTARQGFPEAAGTNTAALAIGTGQVGCEEFSLPAETTVTVDTD